VRTTVRLDDELYAAVKARAARSGRTVAAVIEDALRAQLAAHATRSSTLPTLPVFGGSGVMPGADVESNAALRSTMDEDVPLHARR